MAVIKRHIVRFVDGRDLNRHQRHYQHGLRHRINIDGNVCADGGLGACGVDLFIYVPANTEPCLLRNLSRKARNIRDCNTVTFFALESLGENVLSIA